MAVSKTNITARFAVDPVSSSDTDYNPPQPAHLPPPSKCKDCIVLDVHLVSSTVLDGVRQTVTKEKIKLCEVHLEPDSTSPPMPSLLLQPSKSRRFQLLQKCFLLLQTFFKYRCPAERKIVDAAHWHYEHLQQQYSRSSTKLSEECRTCLTDEDSPYFQHAQQKREDKEILPLAS